jgi:hypothetical protein
MCAEPLYDVERLSEDETSHEFVRRLAYKVVRPADEAFEKDGGGTRHWVRDHFLPALGAEGLRIVPVEGDDRA